LTADDRLCLRLSAYGRIPSPDTDQCQQEQHGTNQGVTSPGRDELHADGPFIAGRRS
jgi:hypothetical protein